MCHPKSDPHKLEDLLFNPGSHLRRSEKDSWTTKRGLVKYIVTYGPVVSFLLLEIGQLFRL